MKHIAKVALIGITTLSLVACSSGTSNSTSKTDAYEYLLDTSDLEKPTIDTTNASGKLKEVLDSGVLKIATSPDYPPAEWIDDKGDIHGSEMMLAKYIADCLGVTLEIETMDFAATLAAVDTNKVDVAFSGYGWKKDRAEAYELSIGYIGDETETSNHTLITTAAHKDDYHSLADFVGSTIIAQATSLQEMYVQDQILALDTDGTTTYEAVKTLDQAILSLASGKCDAVAMDESTAENYVKNSDGAFVLTNINFDLSAYGDYQGNVAAAKKGETTLMDAINQCLEVVKEKGYYTTWYAQAKQESAGESN